MAIQRTADYNRAEAGVIQFSDTYGTLPTGAAAETIQDFDADLTTQVGNTGRFHDSQYPIGVWPALCDYAGVLLVQLRTQQLETLERHGITAQNLQTIAAHELAELHPRLQNLAHSLRGSLLGVLNHAPRSAEHNPTDQNGAEFHIGITHFGDEIYSPLQYLRGLQARNLLAGVGRIPKPSYI